MASHSQVTARERRVIAIGVSVVAIALLVTFAMVPFTRQWLSREDQLAAARERVSYLEGLEGRTAMLEQAATDAERTLSEQPRRVVHARSASLAASVVQSLLQDAADASRLLVTRVETSDASGGSATVPAVTTAGFDVPATVAAYGDIVGVVGFLDILASGPRVFRLDRVVLQRNAALLGAPDVVQLSVSLHAPVIPE